MAKVALLQLVSTPSVEDNLKTVHIHLIKAKKQGVKLIVLPENFAWMGKEGTKMQIAEPYKQGAIQTILSQWAKSYGIWIIAGTILIAEAKDRIKAACLVFNDEGMEIARYDKIHLFKARLSEQESYNESATINPGQDLIVVDTPVGKIGLSVCYDLRFPELYRQLVEKGAEIFAIPSAFTASTGQAHWEVLLRARAIENLCYVLAPNQGGHHENGRQTFGNSMIIEPWGKVIALQKRGEAMVTAEIDRGYLYSLRQKLPCNEQHVL